MIETLFHFAGCGEAYSYYKYLQDKKRKELESVLGDLLTSGWYNYVFKKENAQGEIEINKLAKRTTILIGELPSRMATILKNHQKYLGENLVDTLLIYNEELGKNIMNQRFVDGEPLTMAMLRDNPEILEAFKKLNLSGQMMEVMAGHLFDSMIASTYGDILMMPAQNFLIALRNIYERLSENPPLVPLRLHQSDDIKLANIFVEKDTKKLIYIDVGSTPIAHPFGFIGIRLNILLLRLLLQDKDFSFSEYAKLVGRSRHFKKGTLLK